MPPTLVGQILGGAIAARFASHRSDRLSRLVLVDTLGLGSFQPTPEFGLALNDFMAGPTEETTTGSGANAPSIWTACVIGWVRAGSG